MAEFFAVLAGATVLFVLFKPFFGDLGGFLRCIGFWFTPNILSLFLGRWSEDVWSEMKLFVWLMCGGIVGYAVFNWMAPMASS